VLEVDGILVAIRHFGPEIPKKQAVRELDLINSAGHASEFSLLLLPWLGPIWMREGSDKMDGRCRPLAM